MIGFVRFQARLSLVNMTGHVDSSKNKVKDLMDFTFRLKRKNVMKTHKSGLTQWKTSQLSKRC
jgi:hypothetical protein